MSIKKHLRTKASKKQFEGSNRSQVLKKAIDESMDFAKIHWEIEMEEFARHLDLLNGVVDDPYAYGCGGVVYSTSNYSMYLEDCYVDDDLFWDDFDDDLPDYVDDFFERNGFNEEDLD